MDEPKKRRILDRDFDKVEAFIKSELEDRQNNQFRKAHERKWKEVDRQLSMEPMKRVSPDGRPIKGQEWRSAIELGELTKASEIITADVMRIIFANANWFEPHVELEGQVDPRTGRYVIESGDQEKADGLLRSLMVQQHEDFNFKDRFELAVKEALHHGAFVAEIEWDQQMVADGAKVKSIDSPVIKPYSMWNAYPDPSPSVIGTGMFYTGSMILIEYMPLHKLKGMKGEGWIQSRLKKVKKEEHNEKDNEVKDVKLVKYYGDVVIERADGDDIYLPNMKCITANGTLVYADANKLPYPSVIFAGYERQDPRDPYYTSPIIKQSPIQKFTTVMANKFADAVELRVQPPIEFDANDPDYVANGGPDIAPGAKSGTKSMGKGMKILEIGEPNQALTAMQFGFRQLQEGLGVSSLRQGTESSDRQTATEAKLMEQGSEVRTIDFIGRLERQALRPFLYMQHNLNRKFLKEYEFYSNEMDTPDIVRVVNSDIQVSCHFSVVGAKGILGEKERNQNISNVTVFASGNPLFAPKLKAERILLDMYRDAGKRNPEEWVQAEEGPQIPPEVQQQVQQMQQAMQQMAQELQQAKSGVMVKMAEIDLKRQMAEAENARKQAELQIRRAETIASERTDKAELLAQIEQSNRELALEREKMNREFAQSAQEMRLDFEAKMAKIYADQKTKHEQLEAKLESAKKPRNAKIKRTSEGYEVSES